MADEQQQNDDSRPGGLTGPAASEEKGYRIYLVSDRSLEIFHPVGHRWNFQFPVGHAGDQMKMFAPIRWANDKPPEDMSVHDEACAVATEEAKRQGWI